MISAYSGYFLCWTVLLAGQKLQRDATDVQLTSSLRQGRCWLHCGYTRRGSGEDQDLGGHGCGLDEVSKAEQDDVLFRRGLDGVRPLSHAHQRWNLLRRVSACCGRIEKEDQARPRGNAEGQRSPGGGSGSDSQCSAWQGFGERTRR